MKLKNIKLCDIGLTEYGYAWELQKALHQDRVAGNISDTILFTEHFNTYTIGKSGGEDHLLAGEVELFHKGVSVYRIDRGGDITYHGPGQLVCYPILDLNNFYLDVHRYLRDLEEVVIRCLSHYGIKGHREPEFTGVWVDDEKICAIGVKVSRWVTMHGFAFNVNTDLSHFGRIIPCGIFHKGVTSLSELKGSPRDMDSVKKLVAENIAEVFCAGVELVPPSELLGKYDKVMEKAHAST